MAKYPIAENVGVLGTSIEALKTKIVANLTTKGATDINVDMPLIELIDKIVEVSYQPLPRSASRNRSRIIPNIDASLSTLSEALYEAHVRFKLKLEVVGVVGLTNDMTLNEYADKILEIQSTPQYELYPKTVAVRANGSFGEFYFNTNSGVKIDLSVNNGFTLDRTTGQGPGNFIFRVSGTNNTTTNAKSATITIKLDNGKYPSETIAIAQAAGIKQRILETPYLLKYPGVNPPVSSIRARGGEIYSELADSTVLMRATYVVRWNGIVTEQKNIGIDSFPTLPDPFILLTDGVNVYAGLLTAKNNTTPYTRSAIVVGHNIETGLDVSMIVSQDAGVTNYTYTDVFSNGTDFYANGTNKKYNEVSQTSFGALLTTYWNGIKTAELHHNNNSPQHTIQMMDNQGGFYVVNSNTLYSSNRGIVVGSARSCKVRCVFTDVGVGPVYSEYITVTQDANSLAEIAWGGYYCSGNNKMQDGKQYYSSREWTPTTRLIEINSSYCYPTVTITLDRVDRSGSYLTFVYHRTPVVNLMDDIVLLVNGSVIGESSANNSYGSGSYSGSLSGANCWLEGPNIIGNYNIRYEGNITL